MEVVPTGGALGAEIRDIDLSQDLTGENVAIIHQALLDHCVVFLRKQLLSEADQIRFTNYFGKAVEHVRKQREREHKEIFLISNVKEKGEEIGALGNHELTFHSDLSYLKHPGTISTLYAVEIPSVGGGTQWCNCYAAYEALDPEMKSRLKGLRAVHRHYVEDQNPPEMVDHPVTRTHPETGRKSLYVGPHLTKYIVGMEQAESDGLLRTLYAHAARPEFVWTHQWQVGDLVMWDNRPTMHRREPFPDTERRLMKRTQVFNADDVPFE
ncbi:MAG: TauD/TfdA family dioxygenase [bacterium]|jgi:taurine dioxygenase|nr:TauD/TfdA family dioxygenase [bacterium]